jgi:hypothetical protein
LAARDGCRGGPGTVYDNNNTYITLEAMRIVCKVTGKIFLPDFNDLPTTTKEDCIAALKKAEEMARMK